ncbi:MAG: HAMP domain-containing sensor histidine kinase [Lentimicrobium sp.]|jgi:two-component system phosphate regulon sensor histidine kinase PhoR|nr:HAMP domain-containing sensor histidine kinase [Lentimicrobium sp.]
MKKRTIIWLIIITTLALAGIIIIQFAWVKSAILKEEEQFYKGIEVKMQSVVNRLFASRTYPFSPDSCGEQCNHSTAPILAAINTRQLDSLLQLEFGKDEGSYYWGIFNTSNQYVYVGDTGNYADKILGSTHRISLSCLYDQEKLMLGIWFPAEQQTHLQRILPLMLLALLLIVIVISAFLFTIVAIFRQKRLSEMKNDFVNNMTHEFKTPLSTISLAAEMMLNTTENQTPQRIKRYANIIYQENLRLKEQVDQVLQIAVLEKGEYRLSFSRFDAQQLIKECVRSLQLTILNQGGFITYKPQAQKVWIEADRLHFTNMINNLLDNAIKYSRVYPEVMVISRNNELKHLFIVEIHDKGIGIETANLKYIFRKLYRVHTGDKHDVKGFGLGLFYVKSIAEAHGGSVSVKSEPGLGSIFTLSMPMGTDKTLNIISDESESKNIIG